MKILALFLSLALPAGMMAQTSPGAKPTPPPSPQQAAAAFAVSRPDEGSPFFADREAARILTQPGRQNPRTKQDVLAVYPMARTSDTSAGATFSRFFTDMFASINWRKMRGRKTTENFKLDPAEFSLADRREIEGVYTLRNNTGKIVRLDYPTSQRIDIVTQDATGQAVTRWSDDRAFKPQDGIVIINPKERIEYREKIPTRDMKAGQPYTIQADIVGYPEYTASQPVTPGQ